MKKRVPVPEMLVVGLLVVACGGGPSQRQGVTELDTVDVEEAPDAELSIEEDPQARRVPVGVGGVLPSGIPADVPVFSPASLVDFGELADGLHYIEIDTSAPAAKVRSTVVAQIESAGWRNSGADGGSLNRRKGERRLRVSFEDLKSATRIRYEYTPGP